MSLAGVKGIYTCLDTVHSRTIVRYCHKQDVFSIPRTFTCIELLNVHTHASLDRLAVGTLDVASVDGIVYQFFQDLSERIAVVLQRLSIASEKCVGGLTTEATKRWVRLKGAQSHPFARAEEMRIQICPTIIHFDKLPKTPYYCCLNQWLTL